MAKAKQLQSSDPKSMTVEALSELCHGLLVGLKDDAGEAKKLTAHRNEVRERLTPYLKALRAKLRRQGKKDGQDGWQSWFRQNKKEFGISLSTANRWCGDKKDGALKFADITNVDGIKINGMKFTFTYTFNAAKDRITGLTLVPFETDKMKTVKAAIHPATQTHKPAAPKKLTAADTRIALNKFYRSYKKRGDDDSSQWMQGYLAALAAEYAAHPEWLRVTTDVHFKEVRQWIHARQQNEEGRVGWTQKDKRNWYHEDGRTIVKMGKRYLTFDDKGTITGPNGTVFDNYTLDGAMREKRIEPRPTKTDEPKTIKLTVINEAREIPLPNLEVRP